MRLNTGMGINDLFPNFKLSGRFCLFKLIKVIFPCDKGNGSLKNPSPYYYYTLVGINKSTKKVWHCLNAGLVIKWSNRSYDRDCLQCRANLLGICNLNLILLQHGNDSDHSIIGYVKDVFQMILVFMRPEVGSPLLIFFTCMAYSFNKLAKKCNSTGNSFWLARNSQ